MKLGVFDSGVGGLTILQSLMGANLFDEIIYYGDTARVPYGNRDKEEIVRFSLEALDFFAPHKIDMLILACNTVSAHALAKMQERASFPIIGVIESGVLSLSNQIKDKQSHILIIATKATIDSGIYEKNLRALGYHNLTSLETGRFVPLIEKGIVDGVELESEFRHYFGRFSVNDSNSADSYNSAPNAIILGCTHFPLIKNAISKYFNHKPIMVHPGEAIVEFLKQKYTLSSSPKLPKVHFYASGDKSTLESYAKLWLKS